MSATNQVRIYVCYICEAEFKGVELLTAHMKNHGADKKSDAMSKKTRINKPASKKQRLISKSSFLNTDSHSENWKGQILPTLPKPCRRNMSGLMPQKPKKPDLSPKELALQRALKVQRLIKCREMAPEKPKPEPLEDLSENEQGLLGPTIITSEPDGFMCPGAGETLEGSASMKKGFFSADKQKLEKARKFDVAFNDDLSSVNIKKIEKDGLPYRGERMTTGLSCPECMRTFSHALSLKSHMRSHEQRTEVRCPFCDEVFQQRHMLREHLVDEHKELSGNLVCEECGKVFTRPDSLKSHMVRMHFFEGGLQCSVCMKMFPSQATLETHLRIHTGERPFQCTLCNKNFVQKIHLRTHLKKMHGVEETLSHPCRLCDEMFSDRTALRDHHVTVHSLTYGEYKLAVARLKRDGKYQGSHVKAVRVVEPNFTYQTVPAHGLSDESIVPRNNQVARIAKKSKSIHMFSHIASGNGLGTIMDAMDSDTFGPGTSIKTPRGDDELRMVENAFKVADEMDFMSEGSLMISPQDAHAPDDYYTLPVLMNSSVQKVNSIPGTSKDTDMPSTLQELQVADLESAGELPEFDDSDFGQVSKFESIRNIKVESL